MSKLHIYENLEQRSPEWYAARCGIVTASAIGTLITVGAADASAVECPSCGALPVESCISLASKSPSVLKKPHGERTEAAKSLPPVYTPADTDTARALIMALAAERITAHVEETWISADMYRGIDAEPYARDLYAEHCTKEPVTEVGFMVREYHGILSTDEVTTFKIGYSPDGLVGNDGLLEIKAPRQKGHLSTVVSGEVPAHHMAQLQTGLLVSGRDYIDFVSYSGGMHLWPKRVFPDPKWQAAILAAAEHAEKAINEYVATYEQAVEGLPLTERIDFDNNLGLVF